MTLRERWQSWSAMWRLVASAAGAITVVGTIAGTGWAAATIRQTQERDMRSIVSEMLSREVPPVVERVVTERLEPLRHDIAGLGASIASWRESDLQWRLESVQARASKEELRALEERLQRELDRVRERSPTSAATGAEPSSNRPD